MILICHFEPCFYEYIHLNYNYNQFNSWSDSCAVTVKLFPTSFYSHFYYTEMIMLRINFFHVYFTVRFVSVIWFLSSSNSVNFNYFNGKLSFVAIILLLPWNFIFPYDPVKTFIGLTWWGQNIPFAHVRRTQYRSFLTLVDDETSNTCSSYLSGERLKCRNRCESAL